MKNTRSVNVFYGHIATGIAFMLLGTWVTTQYVAYLLGYQPQLGRPLMVFHGYPVYEPWQWFFWAFHYEAYVPWVFEQASRITYANFFIMFAVMVFLAVRRAKRRKAADSYGTARWASADELQQAGIFVDRGVILAQTNDAAFHTEVSRGSGEVQWKMDKAGGKILRHNGPEHIFCFAPTRSGKGVGLVIPTMLAWNESVIAYDIKKELWSATAGWRRQFSHCWRFEPTAPDSVRFNPLLEIRKGEYEVRDVQNVADILVDPDGSKEHHDHWEKTGHSLLVGVILHVLYAEKDKSLSGVANFLSDPERSMYDTLNYMLTFPHLKDRAHPVVAACAREMLNKIENELSGVVSTAMSFLGLYRDPFIARNTSVSDFAIHDLMNSDNPVSLYFVVPPSDIERTKPLMRLILNQFGRRLTEKIAFANDKKQYRHRLLMMLDEFPSLGRLGFFESELAYMAGYGIKCVMIAQSLNQIEMAYGPNNSILDNSHVRITYGALDERTAKRISDLLGQATEKKLQMNFAGNRLSPWLGHIMESEQESPRPLLTPGEILQLPGDDALVMIGGLPPYRAKKIMYYQDDRFRKRAWLSTPDNHESQQSELLPYQYRENPWLADFGDVVQDVAAQRQQCDSPDSGNKHVDVPTEELLDVGEEILHDNPVLENTISLDGEEKVRSIDRSNRAGIIDLSRTPQGGHLPL